MRPRKCVLVAAGLSVAALAAPASAQWQVRIVDGTAPTTDGNTEINNINEGEVELAENPTVGTDSPDAINYTDGDDGLVAGGVAFPGGVTGTDDFALEAVGVIDVIGGTTGTFNIGVNSDDGFRIRVNNTVVQEFVDIRDDPDAGAQVSAVTLNDGDLIQLTFFERGGGESVEFFADADGSLATTGDTTLVGSTASGIDIVPVPEPAALGLLGLGALGLLARRRR